MPCLVDVVAKAANAPPAGRSGNVGRRKALNEPKPHRPELPGEPSYPKMPGEPPRVQPSKKVAEHWDEQGNRRQD